MADEKYLFNKMTKEFIYREHLFEVAENDVEGEISWHHANTLAGQIGNGWRLPSLTEMDTMVKFKEVLKLKKKAYWISQEDGEKALCANMKWYLLSQSVPKENYRGVRFVKNR